MRSLALPLLPRLERGGASQTGALSPEGPRLVESTIALPAMLAALNNLKPIVPERRWSASTSGLRQVNSRSPWSRQSGWRNARSM